MYARLAALIAALASVSCHHDCRARLAALARFYEAVAAEQATPSRMAVRIAQSQAKANLVTFEGPPADTAKSDVLVVGRKRVIMVPVEGVQQDIQLDDLDDDATGMSLVISPTGETSSLVIEIGADTPVRTVARILLHLARPEIGGSYKSIAIAYQVDGPFEGKVPPQIAGFRPGDVDLAQASRTIAQDATAHCPTLATKLAHLAETSSPAAPKDLAPALTSCDCSVDFAPLEALPWLMRAPVVTVVPLAATAPPLPADDTTWAELVRRNGGKPPAVALPPRAALPPPPPRPHAR